MNASWLLCAVLVVGAAVAEKCSESKDSLGCWKNKAYKAVHQERLEFGGVAVVANGEQESSSPRGDLSVLDHVTSYVKTHDLEMVIPDGSTLRLSARNVDLGKIDVSIKHIDELDELDEQDEQDEEGRSKVKHTIKHGIKHGIKKLKKSKLKKLIVPIVIIIMLKMITFIPLVIGILGIKAFNALQLGFGSFLLSFGIAAFQLCQKLTDAFHRKQAAAWPAAARATSGLEGSDLAFRAYA